MKWFSYDTIHTPLNPKNELLPAGSIPVKTEKTDRLEYAWWGGIKEGSKTYAGVFLVSPVLHTTIQSNNTYTLDMTGIQKGSGQLLTMAISLTDLDFTVKSYQSGITGSDHATSFNYSGSAGSRAAIYSSTNNDPGAIMTYDISHYDAVKNTVTITFRGHAFDAGGNLMNISKGKMTAYIDRK